MQKQLYLITSLFIIASCWSQKLTSSNSEKNGETKKNKVRINILPLDEFFEKTEINGSVSGSMGDFSRGHHHSYNPRLTPENPKNSDIAEANRSTQMISGEVYGPGTFLLLDLGRATKNFSNNKVVEFVYDVNFKSSFAIEAPVFFSHTNSNLVNSKGTQTYSLGFGVPNTGANEEYKGGIPKSGIGLGFSLGYRHGNNNVDDYSANDNFFITKHTQTSPTFTTETGTNIYNYIMDNPNHFESIHTAYSLSDIIDRQSGSGVFEFFLNTRRTFKNEDVLGWNFNFQFYQKRKQDYGYEQGDETIEEVQQTLPNGEIVTINMSTYENLEHETDLKYSLMGGDFRIKAYYLKNNKFHIFVEAMAAGQDIAIESSELYKHFTLNTRQVVLGFNYTFKATE